jgi:integrase
MSDRVPVYRCKRVSGYKYGCVSLTDGTGRRKDVLLGKFGSKGSKAEYARVIAEWEAKDRRGVPEADRKSTDITINELLAAFWDHANVYYRMDGKPTGELSDLRLAQRPLMELYGHELASSFGPLALEAIRRQMITQPIVTRIKIADPKTGKRVWQEKLLRVGLARGVINQRIDKIRRVFKWGVSKELVAPEVYTALATLEGLRAGRSEARETRPIRPVAEALVLDTLPHLAPTVADMVRVLMLTGMRVGELCAMRGADMDLSGAVWTYTPYRHKAQHHGHERVVAIGPKAQHILRHYLKTDAQAPLFAPADSMRDFRIKQRAARKTKVQPSQFCRKKAKPERRPRDRHDTRGIAHAVRRACIKHNLESWHPHQLRHLAGTVARREFGLDHARASLGHRSPGVTTLYAELSKEKAIEVAARLG